MNAQRVVMGGHPFDSKAALREFVKKVLWSAPLGVPLRDDLFVIVLDVLRTRHPHAERKIGCGVASISVEPYLNARCFMIHRIDGTADDFSYRDCFEPLSHARLVIEAFRVAIIDQKDAIKDSAFATGTPYCPVTGAALDYVTSAAHHNNPEFKDLVDAFLTNRGLRRSDVELIDGALLADRALKRAWREYHRAHARILVVSPTGHGMLHDASPEED